MAPWLHDNALQRITAQSVAAFMSALTHPKPRSPPPNRTARRERRSHIRLWKQAPSRRLHQSATRPHQHQARSGAASYESRTTHSRRRPWPIQLEPPSFPRTAQPRSPPHHLPMLVTPPPVPATKPRRGLPACTCHHRTGGEEAPPQPTGLHPTTARRGKGEEVPET